MLVLNLEDPEVSGKLPSFQSVEIDHGRIETRRASVSTDIGRLTGRHDWPGLAAIGKITATRETDAGTTTR